jgi:flagellar hook-associated protein 3 FlgL
LSYDITEHFSGEQIQIINRCTGGYTLEDYPASTFDDSPQLKELYRIQLAYDKLGDTAPTGIEFSTKNAAGEVEAQSPITNITSYSLTDDDAYAPLPDAVHYIHETGELIFGENVYDMLHNAVDISTTYTRTNFYAGELKPEHYFTCTMTDSTKPDQGSITYTQETQDIQYEVNFNQRLTINTQGRDAFSHQIGISISDILNSVNEVVAVENTIAEVEKRLEDTSLTEDERAKYEKMREQLDTELVLKKEIMQNAFSKGIAFSAKEQDRVNIALADLGSRYVRLELTEDRLSNQKVDFTELLSTNEDADLAETIIKYGAAEVIYNASLSAASKVVKSTLLDFI